MCLRRSRGSSLKPRRRTARLRWIAFVFLLLASFLFSIPAYGDVGVILNESLDTSIARITGSGHTAVYLSNICAKSPIKLRLCRPGEAGSVISNYTTLGEDQPYEWNAVPFNVYVYGVEDPEDRPLFGSPEIKGVLEERYREKYLAAYCASKSCQTSGKAEWREMVGASLSRSIYIFVAKTTPHQDEALIREFNALPNVNHFNGFTRNCANFAKRVINTYFPHATHADYVNDFGMTSPKAVARSFTRYALKHPGMEFRVVHIAQVPGTIKRSTVCRTGTEQLYHSKKLLLPMLIFAYHEVPVVMASYLLTGRFNPQKTWEKYPTAEASATEYQLRQAKGAKDRAEVERLEAQRTRERERAAGTAEEWADYRAQLESIAEQSEDEGIAQGNDIFRILENRDRISAESNGALWADAPGPGGVVRVGLSASNISADGSDARLAYELMLERNGRELKSPKHSQETMAEFRSDWARLQQARGVQAETVAESGADEERAPAESLGAGAMGFLH